MMRKREGSEKKMSIIKNIYDGTICPAEDIVPKSASYRPLAKEISNDREYFEGKLSMEDKKRFIKWNEMIHEYEKMTEYANFSYGLKLGAMFAFEILSGKE